MGNRVYNYEIMELIKDHWSPRAFSDEQIPIEDLMAILEAARFAPSCFNEQPWRFIVGHSPETRAKVLSLLNEKNQVWAKKAPVLIIICGKKNYTNNGKFNFYHTFDSGTAWGFLLLEAQRRGYITHGMAGFDKEKTIEAFKLGDVYQPIAAIAIGKLGDKSTLPAELQEIEVPAGRIDLEDLILAK